MSGLGEPLSAEIEVLSATPDELSELSATIAPEEAYAVQGLERPGFHNQIKVLLGKKANGMPVLKLSTTAPVTDPFLDMLVQVDWPTGRLIREFTMLLDPPDYANNVNSATANSNAATAAKGALTPSDTSAATSRNQRVSPQAANRATGKRKSADRRSNDKSSRDQEGVTQAGNASGEASASRGSSSASGESLSTAEILPVTTVKGDTLTAIARQNQVEGLSLDQMLIGIYRANKSAFVADNINRLKVGQIIRVPASEELQAVSPNEAAREVRLHTSDWQQYRNKLAGNVAEMPTAPEDAAEGKQSSTGKITSSTEDKAMPPATGPRDVIKLSKNDATSSKQADAKSLQDKLTALQEEAIAREKSVKEASERTAILEKQIQDMQKLLTMKSQAMADMQKNAATAATPVPAPPAESPKSASGDAEKPITETVPAQQAAAPAAVLVPAPEAPAIVQDKPIAKPIIKTPVAPVAVVEPSFVDTLLEDPLPLGLAALLAIILGGWLLLRNKRKRGLDGFEKSILTSGGLQANTVFGNTLGESVNTGDTSFLTDFSQSSSGMIDTNDVDPIAEAEVYMAYGRDKQAEEILRDAITKEPKRYELHLKLLEVYVGNNDRSAFEATAGELYTSLGAQDPVWAKVAELGRQLEPDNPLYQSESALTTNAGNTSETENNLALNLGAAAIAAGLVAEKSKFDFSVDDELQDEPYAMQDNGMQDTSIQDVEVLNMAAATDAPSLDFEVPDKSKRVENPFEQTISFNADELIRNEIDSPFHADSKTDAALDFPFELENTSTTDPSQVNQTELANDLDFDPDTAITELELGELPQDYVPLTPDANVQPELEGTDKQATATAASEPALFGRVEVEEKTPTAPLLDVELPHTAAPPELSASTSEFAAELPAMGFDIPQSLELDEPEDTSRFNSNLDMSDTLQLPSFEPTVSLASAADVDPVAESTLSQPANEQPNPAVNEPESRPDVTQEAVEDIVFEAIPPQDDGLDLDFDIDPEVMDDSAVSPSNVAAAEAPSIDLSGISFDLDDGSADGSSGIEFPDSALSAEPSEVETKLDLVTAYIDMGDNEGARELLEEILQEGGPDQRVRAQDILTGLN